MRLHVWRLDWCQTCAVMLNFTHILIAWLHIVPLDFTHSGNPVVIIRLALAFYLGFLGVTAAAESPRLIGSLGQQMTTNDPEAYLRYMGASLLWGLQPVLGLSLSSNGSGWVGAGTAYTYRPKETGLFLRVSSMAGLYSQGSGKDLQGPIQFRTALDLGMMQRSGMEYGIGADHRSSARIYKPNPGINTVHLFASVPLR